MEALHESISSRRVVGDHPWELNVTQRGQGSEELQFKLTSLVSGDGLQATGVEYPTGQEGACHSVGCDVQDAVASAESVALVSL
jgi:hypothetical protein